MKRENSNLKRMKLSPKYRQVLQAVEAHGFRSCEEMRNGVFKGHDRSWAWHIMQNLVEAHLVRRVLDSQNRLIGWSATRSKPPPSPKDDAKGKIERGKIPKYANSFRHDLEVRWILDQVEALPVSVRIMTESKLKSELFRNIRGASKREVNRLLSLVPDGRFQITNRGERYEIALEMELTQKTHARSQAKLIHYIAKTNYSLAIYVCGSEQILSALWRNYATVLKRAPEAKFATRPVPIYFVLLADLKNDFLKAKIKSDSDEFAFGDLAV